MQDSHKRSHKEDLINYIKPLSSPPGGSSISDTPEGVLLRGELIHKIKYMKTKDVFFTPYFADSTCTSTSHMQNFATFLIPNHTKIKCKGA